MPRGVQGRLQVSNSLQHISCPPGLSWWRAESLSCESFTEPPVVSFALNAAADSTLTVSVRFDVEIVSIERVPTRAVRFSGVDGRSADSAQNVLFLGYGL